MKNYSCITLQALELSVNLGWLVDERKQPQIVALDANIHFSEVPRACITDELSDTVCYDQIINEIKKMVSAREFRLIEHLAHEIYLCIKTFIPVNTYLNLKLTKKPAIENLTGGAVFSFGDA